MVSSISSSKLKSSWRSSSSLLLSVNDQFWMIRRRVTDWFWLISFNDKCSFFITAFFFFNSTIIVITKRFPLFGFYSGEKTTDRNFWSVLILVGEKYWSPKNFFSDKASFIRKLIFFLRKTRSVTLELEDPSMKVQLQNR